MYCNFVFPVACLFTLNNFFGEQKFFVLMYNTSVFSLVDSPFYFLFKISFPAPICEGIFLCYLPETLLFHLTI